MPTDDIPPGRVPDRWTLIRDATVFQFKLVVDGFRDLLLVPASIVAALISLVDNEDGKPGGQFYRMIASGKHSERMIDLFGAYENDPEEVKREYDFGDMSIDDVVERMESFVVDEYKKGGVTAQAKARLDKVIDAMQKSSREP